MPVVIPQMWQPKMFLQMLPPVLCEESKITLLRTSAREWLLPSLNQVFKFHVAESKLRAATPTLWGNLWRQKWSSPSRAGQAPSQKAWDLGALRPFSVKPITKALLARKSYFILHISHIISSEIDSWPPSNIFPLNCYIFWIKLIFVYQFLIVLFLANIIIIVKIVCIRDYMVLELRVLAPLEIRRSQLRLTIVLITSGGWEWVVLGGS